MIALIYGVQKSISDSFYCLPIRARGLFTLALVGFSIPVMIFADNTLMFLAGSAIVFVGAASDFKRDITKVWHYAAAVIGITLGMASLIIDYGRIELVILFVVISIILRFTKSNFIWWIEIIAFYLILIGIL